MVNNQPKKSMWENWTESEDEISFGKDVVLEHPDGYKVIHAARGWGSFNRSGYIHNFALMLPDGSMYRATKANISQFRCEENAVRTANTLIRAAAKNG